MVSFWSSLLTRASLLQPASYCEVACPFRSLTCHIARAEERLFFVRWCVGPWDVKFVPKYSATYGVLGLQRRHFLGVDWCAKSSYFFHATPHGENVACARRVLSAVFSMKQPERGDESEGVSASSVGKQ